MDTESVGSDTAPPPRASETLSAPLDNAVIYDTSNDASSIQSTSGLLSWARTFKLPLTLVVSQDESSTVNSAKSTFARLTSGLTSRLSPREQTQEQGVDPASSQSNFIGNIAKGLVDTSRSAVRAVQVKARHVVSQNKRRYQEDGYDLDLTYIMENIIAMGFPVGDMSSGLFGYIEGFYRNHMEEVISFLESHHKGKYKVYNLCSERLYDASLLKGKVASFPFDDHSCPPIQLIISFCQSAYSWLKDDVENVVAVHCKEGMARTGLMVSCLLLYLKFFPTAEECVDYYNQKRCYDGKALVLPSQIRYVKYFERVLTYFNGENQPGRRCMLRGFRLHKCPYWIRPHITISDHNGVLFSTKNHPTTKDLMPEEFWFTAPKKGIIVFALPGEPGLTELAGDFKVQFHDRQGDFYFWLNTTMIENRKILDIDDMDGFDKRKFPSPGFQVEIVLVDHNGTPTTPPQRETVIQVSDENPGMSPTPPNEVSSAPIPTQDSQNQPQSQQDKDAVFSDDGADSGTSTEKISQAAAEKSPPPSETNDKEECFTREVEKVSLGKESNSSIAQSGSALEARGSGGGEVSEFKAMAADASVFTFGDDEDYESE